MTRNRLTSRRTALAALAAAGLLWGLTVPLSKLALEWLGGGWLAAARFAIAAPLLALAARGGLRDAAAPAVLASGALGYGLVIVLQNAGIARTSVSHAALIVGAVPALVALIAAALGRGAVGRGAWAGFGVALAGVGLVAGGGGGSASVAGDALVLASVTLSAGFIVAQPRLLAGRDAGGVTAVQMVAGGLAALPAAVLEGAPAAPPGAGPVAALLALAIAGTLLPFALFAHGQSRVEPELAGAFINLEPLVGAAAGALAFADPFGDIQITGAAMILAGIALSTMPGRRREPRIRPGGARRHGRPPTPSVHGGRLHSSPHTTVRERHEQPPQRRARHRRAPLAPLRPRPARMTG